MVYNEALVGKLLLIFQERGRGEEWATFKTRGIDLITPKGENLSLQSYELLYWETEVSVPNPLFEVAQGEGRNTNFRIT